MGWIHEKDPWRRATGSGRREPAPARHGQGAVTGNTGAPARTKLNRLSERGNYGVIEVIIATYYLDQNGFDQGPETNEDWGPAGQNHILPRQDSAPKHMNTLRRKEKCT